MLIGCGLRVTEPLNLLIKDVSLESATLFIRVTKGGNDRVVSMLRSLGQELDRQSVFARSVWERDKRDGIPLELPHQLARKYPEYQFAWPWAWLFPSLDTCRRCGRGWKRPGFLLAPSLMRYLSLFFLGLLTH